MFSVESGTFKKSLIRGHACHNGEQYCFVPLSLPHAQAPEVSSTIAFVPPVPMATW